jgi:hypothetical protein
MFGCRHCFGALGSRAQGLFWADETTLAYQCGQSIALYQPDTKTQRFIPASATITAFCVCPSRHLLAVAERGEKATITVFDLHTLKRRKILTTSSEGTKARCRNMLPASDGRDHAVFKAPQPLASVFHAAARCRSL